MADIGDMALAFDQVVKTDPFVAMVLAPLLSKGAMHLVDLGGEEAINEDICRLCEAGHPDGVPCGLHRNECIFVSKDF